MTQVTFSTEWMMRRNRLLAVACDSVIEARGLLDQLDKILQGTVMGTVPDIEKVVHICHQLSEVKNQILVSLVESSVVPMGAQEELGPGVWQPAAWMPNIKKSRGESSDEKQ